MSRVVGAVLAAFLVTNVTWTTQAGTIGTAIGAISVQPIAHGTLALVLGRHVVLIDPARFVPGRPEPPAEDLQALSGMDVVFVPMNLPYTMSPHDAATCVKAIKPRIVYPYHYFGSDPAIFADALKDTGIEVRLREWYAAGQ